MAADRSFDTWYNCVNERLTTLGTKVLYMVSDRAKALIKLAHTGLSCLEHPGFVSPRPCPGQELYLQRSQFELLKIRTSYDGAPQWSV